MIGQFIIKIRKKEIRELWNDWLCTVCDNCKKYDKIELYYICQLWRPTNDKIWTFARGKNSNKFATYSTAGAHLFGKSAIISALKELYFAIYVYDQDIDQIKERSYKMGPQDIITVADHAIYYSVEERRQNFDFLREAETIDFEAESDYSVDIDTYYLVLLEFINKKFDLDNVFENK